MRSSPAPGKVTLPLIGAYQAANALVAAGLVIASGGLDLSVGAMAALVAGLEILFLNSGAVADPARLIVGAMAVA